MMLRNNWFTFLTCLVWYGLLIIFSIQASGLLQLILMAATAILLTVTIASLVYLFKNWRRFGLKAVIPLAVCVFTIPAAVVTGQKTRHLYFEYRLPMFEELIASVREQDLIAGRKPIQIQTDIAHLVYAERTSKGLLVEFITDMGFPAKHSGYLFSEGGQIDSNSYLAKLWPKKLEVKPKWYRVSD